MVEEDWAVLPKRRNVATTTSAARWRRRNSNDLRPVRIRRTRESNPAAQPKTVVRSPVELRALAGRNHRTRELEVAVASAPTKAVAVEEAMDAERRLFSEWKGAVAAAGRKEKASNGVVLIAAVSEWSKDVEHRR